MVEDFIHLFLLIREVGSHFSRNVSAVKMPITAQLIISIAPVSTLSIVQCSEIL